MCIDLHADARGPTPIPPFEEAESQLRNFLRTEGHEDAIAWAFPDDIYKTFRGDYCVRWPLPGGTRERARMLFDVGRRRGLVGLNAIFSARQHTVVLVEAPYIDEFQGWGAE